MNGPIKASTIVLVGGHLLVTSAASRCVWFIELDDKRVVGKASLHRLPLWKPIAAAFGLGCLWVADAGGCKIWRTLPRLAFSPSLEEVRGCRLGAEPTAVAAGGLGPGPKNGVWVALRGTEHRGSVGQLLRLNPDTLEIIAVISMPHPRRIAVGADAVWVLAEDLLVKVDAVRNVVAQSIPLDFTGWGLAVGEDTVWVGGDNEVVKVDAMTCRLSGRIHLRTGFYDHLALSGDNLWVSSGIGGDVCRIHTRTHDLIGSVDLNSNPGAGAAIRDIAVDKTMAYAVAHDLNGRSFVSVIAAERP
jgi:hypothetical protein